MIENRGLIQIGIEPAERVALDRRGQSFPHHRSANDHPQRVERGLAPIAVGVGQQARLENTVVIACRYKIAQGVTGLQ